MYDLQATRPDHILRLHKSGSNRVKLWNQIHGHKENVSCRSCYLVKMAEGETSQRMGNGKYNMREYRNQCKDIN